MHIELTISTTDDLVAEKRQLFIFIVAMHSECNFMLEWLFLCSQLELPLIDNHIMSIECEILNILKHDLALNNHSVKDGCANIYQ